MADNLVKPAFTALALTGTENSLERYTSSRDSRDIVKEGSKHLVAQRVQAAKAITGITLANQVYTHAIKTADRFAQDAYSRLNADGRTPECQAYIESVTQGLTARYREHIMGLVEVGVTNIAREVSKDVIIPKDEKRGWFR